MMSNAGPLTNILDCYPKAQTFLPDSADRLKTTCISPVDCPQELAYPEAMQLLANPSLSLRLSHQRLGMFRRPPSQPCSSFEYLFGSPSSHISNKCFRVIFQML